MSNTYYCKGNLKHDGRSYKKGDAIALEENQAKHLMKNKVVQSQPIPEEDLEREIETAAADEEVKTPEVGGETRTETGEPSIDGDQTRPENKGGILSSIFGKKKDDEAGDDTKEEGSDTTANTGEGNSIANANAAPQDPENDPSKDL